MTTSATIRILIVDDSEDDAKLIQRELQKGGYILDFRRVDSEASFREALTIGQWDIVTCDYAMPRLNGITAIGILKEICPDLPLIIVSGTIDEETAVEAMRAGARDYVLKDRMTRLPQAIKRELAETAARKKVLDQMLTNEKQLKDAQRQAKIGSWEWDLETNVVSWSDEVFRILGLEPGDVKPSFEQVLSTTHPDDVDRIRNLVVESMRSRRPFAFDYRHLCKDGTIKKIYSRGRPQIGPDGRISKMTGLAQDITERDEVERAFRQSEDQVRQLQKLDAIGRLAGGIAHDYNNMLAAIGLYSDLALEALKDQPEVRENIEQIKVVADRGASLTRQLLMFSRKQTAQPQIIQFNQIANHLEKMLKRLVGETIELVTKFSPDLASVEADPGQIEQVILNLVVNARDAMPNGGKIVIETKNAMLEESHVSPHMRVPPGHYAMISVSDIGVGMSAEVQSRIFEPFFTTKELGKGTGLGLSTVFGIVKQSLGTIGVYSELGKGSVFRIYLPASNATQSEFSPSLPAAAPEQATGTILLVEDEDRLRQLFSKVLSKTGYKVVTASNGAEALEIFKRQGKEIDLCVTDVMMPKMNGAELSEQIREISPTFPVLFMSGYADDIMERAKLIEVNETNFVQKPFPANLLLAKVGALLKK